MNSLRRQNRLRRRTTLGTAARQYTRLPAGICGARFSWLLWDDQLERVTLWYGAF